MDVRKDIGIDKKAKSLYDFMIDRRIIAGPVTPFNKIASDALILYAEKYKWPNSMVPIVWGRLRYAVEQEDVREIMASVLEQEILAKKSSNPNWGESFNGKRMRTRVRELAYKVYSKTFDGTFSN